MNMGAVENTPVACSISPPEIYRAPRCWAEQTYKHLIYWNELDRGGHFAAIEQPEIFVNETEGCVSPTLVPPISRLTTESLLETTL
jgi:hypothetical protein